jgi:hypothetical protein
MFVYLYFLSLSLFFNMASYNTQIDRCLALFSGCRKEGERSGMVVVMEGMVVMEALAMIVKPRDCIAAQCECISHCRFVASSLLRVISGSLISSPSAAAAPLCVVPPLEMVLPLAPRCWRRGKGRRTTISVAAYVPIGGGSIGSGGLHRPIGARRPV